MLDAVKTSEFDKWICSLRDYQVLNKINAKIVQICEQGKIVGDCKQIGHGIAELRFHGHGPGYRVYVAIRRHKLLLLLVGGDKSSQEADIKKAFALLEEWDRNN